MLRLRRVGRPALPRGGPRTDILRLLGRMAQMMQHLETINVVAQQ
jgi:hypothetical protein